MAERKNILFILHTLPWPLEFGGNQAMFNGIKAIVDVANVYVTYRDYNRDNKRKQRAAFIEELGNNVKVFPYIETLGNCSLRKKMLRISEMLDNLVFRNGKEHFLERQLCIKQPSQNEITFIRRIIEDYKIDIVQVEMLSHLAIVSSLPDGVQKIFVHHELGFVRGAQVLHELSGNEYYRSLADTMKIQEVGLLNEYDRVLTLNSLDSEKLRAAGVTVPIHTSFAVIKASDSFRPVIDDYHTLFFIGPSAHRPNYFAMKWFLENCWENLLREDGKFRLKVVGNWDRRSIRTLSPGYRNLEFTGFIEDLSGMLKNGILIAPITIGSGIRMKILEAAANGVPIVSTTVGAEGLPVENGRNCFLADSPDLFVSSIRRLSDRALRQQFVDGLYAVVRERYSMPAFAADRRGMLGLE